jgi:hypothetical protein
MVGLIMNELMSGDLYINTFSNSVILLAPKTLWTLANLWGLVGGKYGAKTQS